MNVQITAQGMVRNSAIGSDNGIAAFYVLPF